MSASTERKNRAAAREAGTDKKLLAQQEAERQAAKSRRRWTIGSICVAILIAAIILLNSGILYTHTTALTVGNRNYSPAELNYAYANQYSTFLSNYGSYASVFGLDTSTGLTGLADQECSMLGEGKTWRDYFLDNAVASLQQGTALKNYADANGITLDESELAEIDSDLTVLDDTAKTYGYANANRFLAAQYGTGVDLRLVRDMMRESTLASKALTTYSDSLQYTDEELEEYYASLDGSRDYFNYAYYYVAAETLPVENSETEGETAVTEQTMLEARASAEAIETAYLDGKDIEDLTERFNAAVEAVFEGDAAEVRSAASGASLGDLSDWLRDGARKSGDHAVLENSSADGYYVALFLSREDNHYPTVSVRHILIQAAASEDGSYSDEAKEAALKRINVIKAEFEAGDQSEESFAALATQYTEDEGSKDNGGLYENIYKGQMVEEFNDFCFGDRKSGDIGIVYGESGSYAGYHLIYFVGEGDLYSNTIARSDLSNDARDGFLTEQTEGLEPQLRYWAKLVG